MERARKKRGKGKERGGEFEVGACWKGSWKDQLS